MRHSQVLTLNQRRTILIAGAGGTGPVRQTRGKQTQQKRESTCHETDEAIAVDAGGFAAGGGRDGGAGGKTCESSLLTERGDCPSAGCRQRRSTALSGRRRLPGRGRTLRARRVLPWTPSSSSRRAATPARCRCATGWWRR